MIFSVAVPVLGQAKFLSTALESLAAQSPEFQIAVMDATPDDSVQRVLSAYAPLLHYTRHGADEGQSAAIQEGWDRTSGDIVSWLCADDYLFPYAFHEVEKIFRDQPHVDVVYGDSIFVNESGHFLRYFPAINSDISRIGRDCCVSQPSCFVRRTAMERVGKLNQDLHYVMDWDLWTRLFEMGATFFYMQKPLSAVRIYQGTKTSSKSSRRFSEIWDHLAKHTGYFRALRSLVSFHLIDFYYREFGSPSVSIFKRFLFYAFDTLQRILTRLTPRHTSHGTTLYGLENRTNRVRGQCQIHLPIFGGRRLSSIVVVVEDARGLQAIVNGKESRCLVSENRGQECRHVFEIPRPQQHNQHHFHISLQSVEPIDWKVISVHFE